MTNTGSRWFYSVPLLCLHLFIPAAAGRPCCGEQGDTQRKRTPCSCRPTKQGHRDEQIAPVVNPPTPLISTGPRLISKSRMRVMWTPDLSLERCLSQDGATGPACPHSPPEALFLCSFFLSFSRASVRCPMWKAVAVRWCGKRATGHESNPLEFVWRRCGRGGSYELTTA